MSVFHILQQIVIVLILVVGIRSTGAVAEIVTTSSSTSDAVVNKLNSIRGRALRINKSDKADEFARASDEERTNGIASKLSKLLDTISDKFSDKNRLMDRWAEAGKSDDFVKKQLELRGLSGDALKAHKNYNFFEMFAGRRNVLRLESWIATEASTSRVWTQQGLGYIHTWDDLKKAMDTDAFKLYMTYGSIFDTTANSNMGTISIPAMGRDASWMEKIARIVSWKYDDKPEEYVMKVLGFDKLSQETLQANKNGEAFLLFWLLKNEHTGQLSKKELFEKLQEFEKLSPAELNKLKKKDSLEVAQEKIRALLMEVMGVKNLTKEEMILSGKYHTYKYLWGLIKTKKETMDEQIAILLERLSPRY